MRAPAPEVREGRGDETGRCSWNPAEGEDPISDRCVDAALR